MRWIDIEDVSSLRQTISGMDKKQFELIDPQEETYYSDCDSNDLMEINYSTYSELFDCIEKTSGDDDLSLAKKLAQLSIKYRNKITSDDVENNRPLDYIYVF